MGLGNSKIKSQAQTLSLSSGILGGYWDLRNTPSWILVFASECFLAFQVVTEHMKLRLELPWEPSLSWLMALCKWTCKLVLVGLKMQVHSWKPRQVLLPLHRYARDVKHFLIGPVCFRWDYFSLPELQLPSFIIYKTTGRRFYFFLNTWPCYYVVQASLEHSNWNDLSLPRTGLWFYRCSSIEPDWATVFSVHWDVVDLLTFE